MEARAACATSEAAHEWAGWPWPGSVSLRLDVFFVIEERTG